MTTYGLSGLNVSCSIVEDGLKYGFKGLKNFFALNPGTQLDAQETRQRGCGALLHSFTCFASAKSTQLSALMS